MSLFGDTLHAMLHYYPKVYQISKKTMPALRHQKKKAKARCWWKILGVIKVGRKYIYINQYFEVETVLNWIKIDVLRRDHRTSVAAVSKVQGLMSCLAGVRGFESRTPHYPLRG